MIIQMIPHTACNWIYDLSETGYQQHQQLLERSGNIMCTNVIPNPIHSSTVLHSPSNSFILNFNNNIPDEIDVIPPPIKPINKENKML